MAPERDDEPRDDSDAVRRAAQDSAGELARMGIDPRALGLEPMPPAVLPAGGSAPGPGAPGEGAGRRIRGGEGAGRPASGGADAGVARGVARLEAAPGPAVNGAAHTVVPPPPGPVSGMPAARAFGPTTYGRPRSGDDMPPGMADPPRAGARPHGAAAGPATGPAAGPEGVDSTLSRPIAGLARPSSPATDYLEPLAQVMTPVSLRPGAAARRLVRAVSFGLLDPGAAATIERERQLVARARVRRPEPRVIAFLAGKGGVGTTTTVAGVALTLATVRADQTALVCARAGGSALGERLLGEPAPRLPVEFDAADPPDPLWVHGNLAVIDGPPWHAPAPVEPFAALLEHLRSRHPMTLLDVGNDLSEAAQRAVVRADQVVLVTSASQDAVAAIQLAVSRVHQIDPFRLNTLVVALVCLNTRQFRRTLRGLRAQLGVRGPRIVPVGFDPWLATGGRVEPVHLRAATREAYLQLAGLVVEPGAEQQWFAQPGGQGGQGAPGTEGLAPPTVPAQPSPPAGGSWQAGPGGRR